MAAGDMTFYNGYLANPDDVDWTNDTIKLAIMGSGYTPADADEFWDDISANEISAVANYSAGGETITGRSVTRNDTLDRGEYNANDVPWPSLGTSTNSFLVAYKSTGTPSTSRLIFRLEAANSDGNNYTVEWGANVFRMKQAVA